MKGTFSMRKHTMRHLLHGLLDLLPLLLIPVFMVYSHRHAIEDNEVITGGVTYSQRYETNEIIYNNGVIDTDSLINGNIYLVEYNLTNFSDQLTIYDSSTSTFIVNGYELYYPAVVRFGKFTTTPVTYYIQRNVGNRYGLNTSDSFTIVFENKAYLTTAFFDYFNISAYYGQEFNPYERDTTDTVTYNDSDIMSQFTYCLYNATTKYFNTDSVFNLGAVHSWIENSMFNGSMPFGVTIVYHIIAYEFIMDIIFLIYALFMFVVDFATDFLEHCFSWSRKGGR